ncbi:MAG: DNA polymerase III subunit beta [Alphaproteobacteria bacterium]|nr:DNA polymerase III subunit beta [Alphaproteobacteria bacterium]
MKFKIERATLLRSLSHVQGIVERRNTIPILSNVLLEARQGRVRLSATDLDLEIVELVKADVFQEGGTTAPAHTLHDIVRKLPDGAEVELTLDAAEGRLTVRAGLARFQLACLPREDFPAMTAGDLPNRFALGPGELKRMIDKTRFAISSEDTRYYLNGIYLHVAEGDGEARLRAVATDGHRLARYEIAAPAGAQGMPGVIVPRKVVGEIRKLADEAEGAIEVGVSDAKIRFAFDDIVLTSKLIDGTFPDYARVIPAGNDRELHVPAHELAQAVDRVATVSSERSRAVKLSLEEDRLTLSVTAPESGSATEELEVGYRAPALQIGFNARYLLDILTQIEGDKGLLLLADAGSPTIVRDEEDDGALYVLMPMRV